MNELNFRLAKFTLIGSLTGVLLGGAITFFVQRYTINQNAEINKQKEALKLYGELAESANRINSLVLSKYQTQINASKSRYYCYQTPNDEIRKLEFQMDYPITSKLYQEEHDEKAHFISLLSQLELSMDVRISDEQYNNILNYRYIRIDTLLNATCVDNSLIIGDAGRKLYDDFYADCSDKMKNSITQMMNGLYYQLYDNKKAQK